MAEGKREGVGTAWACEEELTERRENCGVSSKGR